MFNFFPSSEIDIRIALKAPISESPFKCIEDSKPSSVVPKWTTGTRNGTEYWLKLGPADTFPIAPQVSLTFDHSDLSIKGKIQFSPKAQLALKIWLWFATVGFFGMVGKLIFEVALDDGMVPYQFNGEAGEVRAIPALLAFLVAHQAAFFLGPAVLINQSWKKISGLVEKVRLDLTNAESNPLDEEISAARTGRSTTNKQNYAGRSVP